jgi:hypothetical protein
LVVLTGLAPPGGAQADFYIVQDQKTKICSVVEELPRGGPAVAVVSTRPYRSRTEAEDALPAVDLCSSSD